MELDGFIHACLATSVRIDHKQVYFWKETCIYDDLFYLLKCHQERSHLRGCVNASIGRVILRAVDILVGAIRGDAPELQEVQALRAIATGQQFDSSPS